MTLRLIGGPGTKPPANYMGGKRRWAESILDEMGTRGSRPSRVVLCDAGPWGRFWHTLLVDREAPAVAAHLRSMARRRRKGALLHDALVSEGQPRGCAAWAASFIALQACAANAKPVKALPGGAWRTPGYAHATPTALAKGFVGRLRPDLLALRVERVAALRWPAVDVHCGDVAEVPVVAGADVYLDPPYAGTTGYGVDTDAMEVAAKWAAAGCRVAVSEGRPLDWPGWHHARPGAVADWRPSTFAKTDEWLTMNTPPMGARQIGLDLD